MVFALIWFLPSAAISDQLTLTEIRLLGEEIEITWEGEAKGHAVEMAYDLPEWTTVAYSTKSTARIPITPADSHAYVRIRSLPDDEELFVESEERRTTLEAILETLKRIPQESVDQTNEAVAAHLKTVSQLSRVVVSNNCIWAEFPDGRYLTVVNNRKTDTVADVAVDRASFEPLALIEEPPGAQREVRANATITGIPESDKVFIISSRLLAGSFSHRRLDWRTGNDLAAWFRDSDYEVKRSDATLAAFENVKNAGVFYYEGHSGLHDKLNRFIIVSDTTINSAFPLRFRNLVNGYAIVMPRVNEGRIHFSISKGFADAFMTFSKNSVVFINSCSSSQSSGFFGEKSHRPLHLGWDEQSADLFAWRAARYVFDRLLGANEAFHPIAAPDLGVSPPQRAFDRVAVMRKMTERGFVRSFRLRGKKLISANLVVNQNQSSFGILAPSIERMWVDENKEELHINGIFDADAKTEIRVTGNGKAIISPNSVTHREVICPLGATDSPSAGHVTVVQRGHKSNTIPLTEWRVKATMVKEFTPVNKEPHATSELELHFRADIHGSRNVPDAEPAVAGGGAQMAKDSTARVVSATGIYKQPDRDRTVEWKLESPVEVPFANIRGSLTYGARGQASIFASVRAGSVMTVVETIDGKEHTYMFEPGTGAGPGGTKSTYNSSDFRLHQAKDPAAGGQGSFGWKTTVPKYPPTGKFAR